MSRSRLGRRAAWGVPAVAAVAAVLVTAPSLLTSASADEHPQLPTLTPAQLLAAVESSDTQALSGTVVETARLGLPDLPGGDNAGTFDWQSLVTGSHTVRLWFDGADKQRVALLGQLSESDLVRSGSDVWTYQSGTSAVDHLVLPQHTDSTPEPSASDLTPSAAADKALAALDPTTSVTVDATQVVAGRSAYTLVLAPKDTTSTVRKVAIAVDSATKVPLRVQVYGSGDSAALETGFTDVSFDRPSASVFAFTPPSGATVTEHALPADGTAPESAPEADGAKPSVVGTGWTSVLVVPAPTSDSSSGNSDGSTQRLLDSASTTLPNGDRLVRTSLLNVLLTTDGRVLAGAVSPERLQQVAGG